MPPQSAILGPSQDSHVKFTLQPKYEMYLNFESAICREPGDPLRLSYAADHPLAAEFKEQMTALGREYKGNGEYLSVHHPDTPGALDDAPNATALMLMGAARGKWVTFCSFSNFQVEAAMSFSEHFGFSFYDMTILVEKDKHERTRQHEGGHKYFGDEKGAMLTKKEFNPKATSRVCYEPFPHLQDYYEVGVAGLLAEALAIQRASNPECTIDVARLPALAQQIYDTFKGEKPDPNTEIAMEPYVPMSCSYPSAIKSQLSVSDLSHPIKLGLSQDRLVDAMVTVANRLNDVGEWEHFQRFVDREFLQYGE